MVNLEIGLADVMELLRIQKIMIIYWCLSMLIMEIYIIIYQKILRKFLGMIKLIQFIGFQLGKVLYFYLFFYINI